MPQLEDNLKLGLEAVKYAKGQVGRSSNQIYFKPWRPSTDSKRNLFILRRNARRKYLNRSRMAPGYKNDTISQRRQELFDVLPVKPLSQTEGSQNRHHEEDLG